MSAPSITRPRLLVSILSLLVRLAPTGRKFFQRTILLRKTMVAAERFSLPEGLHWVLAGPSEIARIDAHAEATSRTAYRRRYDRGDSCVCLVKGSEIVAYRWIVRGKACLFCGFGSRYEIRFLPLKRNQAFLYDLYVYAAHRRNGYGILLCRVIFNLLKDEGIDEVFCLADPENASVIRMDLRLGFEAVRMAYGVRIRQWSAVFFGPQPDRRLQAWISRFGSGASIH